MRVRIDADQLPGRHFVSDGVPLDNVHVGVQIGREPAGLVAGDAPSASWEVEVAAGRVDDDGVIDLRGPAVQGRRGDRFLYLTWGNVGADGSFAMFRRAKLMIADIDRELLATAVETEGTMVATLGLTDDRGGPLCARVRPPAVTWRAG